VLAEKYKSVRCKLSASDYNQRGRFIIIVILIILALCLRVSLIKVQTSDYIGFIKPWTDFLAAHGLHAFRYDFSNYNTPYLLLLLIGTSFHLPDIIMVKLISIVFDLVLSYSVFLLVRHFKPLGLIKWVAAVTLLFLPTVFINSGLWGQCDSIYTSFLVFSLYNCLKNNPGKSWFFFGIALAFKLQAIFFLPFILLMTLNKRWKLYTPLYALAIFLLLSCLPILEGRSISSTMSIYINQTQSSAGQQVLSLNAPTFYQWLPNNLYFRQLRRCGIVLAASIGIAIVAFAFRKKPYTKKELLLLATVSVYTIPFFLPQMHERYFYPAEVFSLILAFILPRLSWVAAAMQLVTLMAYIPYLTNSQEAPPIPFDVLSLIVFIIIFSLFTYIFKSQSVTKKSRPAIAD
jgi:Gpi18-like mannosyltransferase